MKFTLYLKGAGAAVVLSAGPALAAKDGPRSAAPAVRSAQSIPSPAASKEYRSTRGQDVEIASAAADPPYCSGNKHGIYRGNGQKNGKGVALTCNDSPG